MKNARKPHPDGAAGDRDPFQAYVVRALEKLNEASERADARWEAWQENWKASQENWKTWEARWEKRMEAWERRQEERHREFLHAVESIVRTIEGTSQRTIAALREVSTEIRRGRAQTRLVGQALHEVTAELRALRHSRRPSRDGSDGATRPRGPRP